MHDDDAARLAPVIATLRAAGCVFAEDEAALLDAEAAGPAELAALVARRAAGEPLEQVIGWAEFCGLRIALEPGVFVPRMRTEVLAREAIALVRAAVAAASNDLAVATRDAAAVVVVDLCCGAGAIAAAIAAAVPTGVDLHATDVEPAAVRCAQVNLAGNGQVHAGDLFAALPPGLRGRVAVLTANTPYVPTGEIGLLPAEARDHEPRVTLDGGADGLDVQRRIATEAPAWLAPGGHLLVEVGAHQAATAEAVFATAGLTTRRVVDADLEATVVVATRPA